MEILNILSCFYNCLSTSNDEYVSCRDQPRYSFFSFDTKMIVYTPYNQHSLKTKHSIFWKTRCCKMYKVETLWRGQQIKQVQLNFQVALSRSEIQAVSFLFHVGFWVSIRFQILWRKFCLWVYTEIFQVSPFENVDVVPDGEAFTLANTYIKAHFSDQGLLQVSLWRFKREKLTCECIFAGDNHNGGQHGDGGQNWVYSIWNSKQGGQKWSVPLLAWYS